MPFFKTKRNFEQKYGTKNVLSLRFGVLTLQKRTSDLAVCVTHPIFATSEIWGRSKSSPLP